MGTTAGISVEIVRMLIKRLLSLGGINLVHEVKVEVVDASVSVNVIWLLAVLAIVSDRKFAFQQECWSEEGHTRLGPKTKFKNGL